MGGGVSSDYFVSTQLQLWLFCCWGCGCCWAVTIAPKVNSWRSEVGSVDRLQNSTYGLVFGLQYSTLGWVVGLQYSSLGRVVQLHY